MRTLLVIFALVPFVAASTTSYVARAETPTASSQTAAATKNKKAKKPLPPPTRGPTASPTPSSEPRDYKY